MLHFKITFLNIIIITKVCALVTHAVPAKEIKDCIDAMKFVFGENKTPLDCVRHAIKHLILIGDLKNNLYKDVISYIDVLKKASSAESIQGIEIFCKELIPEYIRKEELIKKIKNAGLNPTRFLSGIFTFLVKQNDHNEYVLDEKPVRSRFAKNGDNSYNFSDCRQILIEDFIDNSRYKTMIRAMNYHKQGRILSRYVHTFGTYGYYYLEHVAECVEINIAAVDDPEKHCYRINGGLYDDYYSPNKETYEVEENNGTKYNEEKALLRPLLS